MGVGEASTIEQLLESNRRRGAFLTPRQRAGGWRDAWGPLVERLPEPYWLYSEDESQPLALGFPLKVSRDWEVFTRQLSRLVSAEATYRLALLRGEGFDKSSLVEQRRAVAEKFSANLENALTHDHDQRLPELLWLILTRQSALAISQVLKEMDLKGTVERREESEVIRLAVAERLTDIFRRAEVDATSRLEPRQARSTPPAGPTFADQLRRDVLPWAWEELGDNLAELAVFVERCLRLARPQFLRLLNEVAPRIEKLLARDHNLRLALSLHEKDLESLSGQRLLLHPALRALLPRWHHPEVPSLIAHELQVLEQLEAILTRFEVIAALRRAVLPVTVQDRQILTRVGSYFVPISTGTRPLDFTQPGVADSSVRRYGLLYDLADFTHQLEELRRRGRQVEQHGLLSMTKFLQQVEEIRARHRLKFEKFLGDGAFYSARSPRPILVAAAELRILYERWRRQGFPFDRGLRLAANVGTYHLIPMTAGRGGRPHFEFFGHALVELVRLTTGKTTKEVDDMTDFLLAAGYDINRVLEFLEPVRRKTRLPDHAKERPYAAYLTENGELANLGGVVTEAFLHDLDAELAATPLRRTEAYGLQWLLLPFEPERPEKPWIGLRLLGNARLKGIDPGPLAEMVVLDQPPPDSEPLPPGTPLVPTLHRLASPLAEASSVQEGEGADPKVPPELCVVSALDDAKQRRWYLGLYSRDQDAVLGAHPVPMPSSPDSEPVEVWLFRQREQLAILYDGLRRLGGGFNIPLASMRHRPGFFSCLLASPHHAIG